MTLCVSSIGEQSRRIQKLAQDYLKNIQSAFAHEFVYKELFREHDLPRNDPRRLEHYNKAKEKNDAAEKARVEHAR